MEKRTKMSNIDRAKQFAPFDALKGLQNALRVKEYEHDRLLKGDLSSEQIDIMTKNLLAIKRNSIIKIKYFFDGFYLEEIGKSKVDLINRIIEINSKKILFDDIFSIDILED